MTDCQQQQWKKTILDEVADIIDCQHSTLKWTSNGCFVVRNYNLDNGRIVKEKISYTDEENYLNRIKRARPERSNIILFRKAPLILRLQVLILKDRLCYVHQKYY